MLRNNQFAVGVNAVRQVGHVFAFSNQGLMQTIWNSWPHLKR